MKLFSKWTLKWRLITGFLLCAMITAVSGGAGIVSLSLIQNRIERTSRAITHNNDLQRIPIRKIVTSVVNATSIGELAKTDEKFKRWLTGNNSSNSEDIKDILSRIKKLSNDKQHQLAELKSLSSLYEKFLLTMGDIARNASAISEKAEQTATQEIEGIMMGAFHHFAGDSKTVSGKATAENLADFKEDLLFQSAMSISTVRAAMAVLANCHETNSIIKDAFSAEEKASTEKYHHAIDKLIGRTNSEFVELPDGTEKEKLITATIALKSLSTDIFSQKEKLIDTEKKLNTMIAAMEQKMNDFDKATVDAATAMTSNAEETLRMSSDLARKWQYGQLVLVICAICAALGIGLCISGQIVTPIRNMIKGLSAGADQVASVSGQVSSASHLLANGASGQAAAIEQTSSGIQEMRSMAIKNAESAIKADSLMKNVNQVATQANQAMNSLATAMNDIYSASQETSKIIKTIDEVAFQTNLLALNAAVEAARAGDAGAGFAVVADEVRSLALRATKAANDTTTLIERSAQGIEKGHGIVTETLAAIHRVAEDSSQVSALVGDIAAASNDQATGIEQIRKAADEIEKVTQQNAANAEESAAASEELSAQAEEMTHIVKGLSAMVNGNFPAEADNKSLILIEK